MRTSAFFKVSDPAAAIADLVMYDSNNTDGITTVGTNGTDITFTLWLSNRGPDPATSVQVTDAVPANTTFVSESQDSGPTFTCTNPEVDSTGTTNCTIDSLAPGASARFTLIYQITPGTPAGTVISNTATISSATTELLADDNTETSTVNVVGGASQPCVLECPDNINTSATTTVSGQRGTYVSFSPDTTGDCGSVTSVPASGTFFTVGTTTVNVTSESGGGCSFTVTVTDTGGPTISCPSNVSKNAATGECSATVTAQELGTPTASSGATVDATRADGLELTDPFPRGQTIVTWTATDAQGRTATCTQSVTIAATNSGTVTVTAPADVTIGTGPDANTCAVFVSDERLGAADAEDNCGSVNATRSGVPSGNVFPKGTTTVTYTAVDGAGNSVTATQHVTVVDDTPPVIFAPADASYTCPSEVPAANPSQATGPPFDANGNPQTVPPYDNCGTPTVTVSESSSGAGSASSPRIITRTFTATDSSGNSSSAVQTITVIDSTPPSFTSVPGAVTVGTGAGATSCSAVVSDAQLGNATASDNCAGVTVTRSGVPAGNAFPKGTTTVTYTATDAAGNTATATQTVTVNDTTPPVITITGANPMTVECHTTFTDPGATANDACDGSVAVTSSGTVNANVPGTYTITYSAHDVPGNTATSTRTVQVVDSTKPVITLNGQAHSMWPPNHKYQTFNITDFVTSASDTCDTSININSVVISKVTSDETENGNGDGNTSNDIVIASGCKSVQLRSERDGGSNGRVYTITFRVRDASGNETTVTAKVTVPANQGGGSAVDDGPHYTVNSSCP